MKITNEQLRRIIKEEIEAVLEAPFRGDMTVGPAPFNPQKRSQGDGSSFHRNLDNMKQQKGEAVDKFEEGHLVLVKNRDREFCLIFPTYQGDAQYSWVLFKDFIKMFPAAAKLLEPTIKAAKNPPEKSGVIQKINPEAFHAAIDQVVTNRSRCIGNDVTKAEVYYDAIVDVESSYKSPLGRCAKA